MNGNDLIKAETRGLTGPDAVNHLHLLLLNEYGASNGRAHEEGA